MSAPTAPCAGQSALFDSRHPSDHELAKRFCDTCPLYSACWDNLQAVLRSPKSRGGSPEGTWAGMLYGGLNLRGEPVETVGCGSEAAYQRHRAHGEETDEACRQAHRLVNRIKYARAKEAQAS